LAAFVAPFPLRNHPVDLSRPRRRTMKNTHPASRTLILIVAGCLFLTVVGVKLAVIDRFGTDLPYWDQWAKEGEMVFAPFLERGAFWSTLFVPHNEHRIAPTLALNLGLLLAGGQWDARVQCTASAMLHAYLAAWLFFCIARAVDRKWLGPLAVFIALVIASPIAADNILVGFQSVYYFLAIFSLTALWLLIDTPVLTFRWCGGLVCGGLAIISMGSGLLCAIPLVILGILGSCRPAHRKEGVGMLLAGIILGALGGYLRTPTPWHETLKAHSLIDFASYTLSCLSWPVPNQRWIGLVIWAPWLVLVYKTWRRVEGAGSRLVPFTIAGGLWVLLQVAAVAYSRGTGGGAPAVRYGDTFAIGMILSFTALIIILESRSRRFGIGSAAWVLVAVGALAQGTRESLRLHLPTKAAEFVAFEHSVRAFVQSDDYATFEKAQLPFPIASWLARILRSPLIRNTLPWSVRAPLALQPDGAVLGPVGSQASDHGKFAWWLFEPLPPGTNAMATIGSFSATGAPIAQASPIRWQRHTAPALVFALPAAQGAAYIKLQPVPSPAAPSWRGPVEMSGLSHLCWRAAGSGVFVAGAAFAALLFCAARNYWATARNREPTRIFSK